MKMFSAETNTPYPVVDGNCTATGIVYSRVRRRLTYQRGLR
jgi:hypothetical protein